MPSPVEGLKGGRLARAVTTAAIGAKLLGSLAGAEATASGVQSPSQTSESTPRPPIVEPYATPSRPETLSGPSFKLESVNPLDAASTFGDVDLTQAELEASPIQVGAFYIPDTGPTTQILMAGGPGAGSYKTIPQNLRLSTLSSQTQSFEPYEPKGNLPVLPYTDIPDSILPLSDGSTLLGYGANNYYRMDASGNVRQINLPLSSGGLMGIKAIPNVSNEVLVNDTSPGLPFIHNTQTDAITTLDLGGYKTDTAFDLATVPGNPNLTRATFSINFAAGYLDVVFNNQTNQVVSVTRKHTEVGETSALFVKKNSDGSVNKKYIADALNVAGNLSIIDDATDTLVQQYPINNILDGKGIPNYGTGSFRVTSLQIVGNTILGLGYYNSTVDGSGRAVMAVWPDGVDPNSNPSQVQVVQLENNVFDTGVTYQDDSKVGTFNGIQGVFMNIENLGLAFVELNSNGQPVSGIPLFPDKLAAPPPEPSPTPSPVPTEKPKQYTIDLPVVVKDAKQ